MQHESSLAQIGNPKGKSLGQSVYETLREAIILFKFMPGQMIYENELAETLGVSRTPIREAIRILVSEQLLEVLPQRGTRVAFISCAKVAEARYVRELLEIGAFRTAAGVWHAEAHGSVAENLERLIAQQEEMANRGDIAGFLQVDEAFHRAIMELTGNATLIGLVDNMRAHLNRLRLFAIRQIGDTQRLILEHRQLFELLRNNDEEAVVALLYRHLQHLIYELPELRKQSPQFFID